MIYSILGIWILYAVVEGWREAPLWHYRINSPDYSKLNKINHHVEFSIQRVLALSLAFISTYYIKDIWSALIYLPFNMLIFSFFHNGMLYTIRHYLSKKVNPDNPNMWIYDKTWFAQSTTSTSPLTKIMTPISRTIQMVLGVAGYILCDIFLKF